MKISDEIMAGLADQGIDITEKSKCISDENKAAARLVKVSEMIEEEDVMVRKRDIAITSCHWFGTNQYLTNISKCQSISYPDAL